MWAAKAYLAKNISISHKNEVLNRNLHRTQIYRFSRGDETFVLNNFDILKTSGELRLAILLTATKKIHHRYGYF